MKTNPKINFLVRRAAKNELVHFDYIKDDGSRSKRTLRIGINVEKKFEREGNPIKKIGNWASNIERKGKNNCIILRKGDVVIQGTDMADGHFKYFKINGIENLH